MRTVLIGMVALVMMASGCTYSVAAPDAARIAEVAAIGAEVMPFDLEKTTHIFQKTDGGGLQQVVVDSLEDADQIELIRRHLAEEAGRFAEGDFHDPSMIHGEHMPGLHELTLGASMIRIEYSEIEDGAQIQYMTEDPELVDAIHKWFDAQVADHGSHAATHR